MLTGLISILSWDVEYFTITDVDIPSPPERLDSRFKSTVSNSVKLWDVVTATCAVISCALPVTCVWFDSSKYSKLSFGAVLKNIVSPVISVESPIKSLEILLANTVEPVPRLKLDVDDKVVPVSYTHLTLPTTWSV